MIYFFKSSFFVGACFISLLSYSQNTDWQLKKEAEGITVYTREVSGTNIKEFKASSIISTSKESILKVLLKVKQYPDWIEDVSGAEELFFNGDSLGMYYQMDLPWPLQDRDMAMVSHITYMDDNSVLLNINGNSSLRSENKKFIRIKEVRGQWHVIPLDKNTSEVTYRFLADPEGFLPAWVVNIFIVDGPFKTLQNLKEYVKQ